LSPDPAAGNPDGRSRGPPGAIQACDDPLEHYLQFGNHENRLTFADGHFG